MKKYIFVSIIILMLFYINTSCNQKNNCGFDKSEKSKTKYYLCDSLLQNDTIVFTGYERENIFESEQDNIKQDEIDLFLPDGYEVLNISKSIDILPSIWSDLNDDVSSQYVSLEMLKLNCKITENEILKNNKLIIPKFDSTIKKKLYDSNGGKLDKQSIIKAINEEFNNIINVYRKNSTKSEINDLYRDRNTYLGYLKNYSNWDTESSSKFDLLLHKYYITLNLKMNDKVRRFTFVYYPIHGN